MSTEAAAGTLIKRDKLTVGESLQHLDTPHHDDLVTLRPGGAPIPQRARRGHRAADILAYRRARPEGSSYSELHGRFGEPGIRAIDRLVTSGDVLRPKRAHYVAAAPAGAELPTVPGGVSGRTVCTMLTVLSMALTVGTLLAQTWVLRQFKPDSSSAVNC